MLTKTEIFRAVIVSACILFSAATHAFNLNEAKEFYSIALMQEQSGRYNQAEDNYLTAISILKNHVSPAHPMIADAYNNLAGIYYRQKQYEKALEYVDNAILIYDANFGPNHPQTLRAKANRNLIVEWANKMLGIH